VPPRRHLREATLVRLTAPLGAEADRSNPVEARTRSNLKCTLGARDKQTRAEEPSDGSTRFTAMGKSLF
jgi:hypothetical protein